MRYRIVHGVEYRYSAQVFLEPHVIRLTPRGEPAQSLLSAKLTVEPEPMRLTHTLDAEGNSVTYAWFVNLTDRLHIQIESEVQTRRDNPFDYLLLDAAYARLPIAYPPGLAGALTASLRQPERPDASVAGLAREAAESAGNDTAAFLGVLNQRLYDEVEIAVRPDGDPFPPEQTIASRTGSCRDVAVAFMACCRAMGLAARFVSGYQEGDPGSDERHLHAWAEVYLPGGGWRGYDPTHGLAVADRHVVLAAAAEPPGAAAVEGTFRRTGASAVMSTSLEFDTLPG